MGCKDSHFTRYSATSRPPSLFVTGFRRDAARGEGESFQPGAGYIVSRSRSIPSVRGAAFLGPAYNIYRLDLPHVFDSTHGIIFSLVCNISSVRFRHISLDILHVFSSGHIGAWLAAYHRFGSQHIFSPVSNISPVRFTTYLSPGAQHISACLAPPHRSIAPRGAASPLLGSKTGAPRDDAPVEEFHTALPNPLQLPLRQNPGWQAPISWRRSR